MLRFLPDKMAREKRREDVADLKHKGQTEVDPLLDVVLNWRLTGELQKAATEFKHSAVDDLKLDPYSTFLHLRDGFGGHYYGELDSKRRRHGFGRCRWSNGDLYYGEWTKDKMSGEGSYLWIQTGSIYVGTWKSGECHGFGTYVCGPGKEKAPLDTTGFILKGLWKRGHPKKVQVLSARIGNEQKLKLTASDDDDGNDDNDQELVPLLL